MFESVLVANRGEIALRVMRTLRSLGLRSVAVFTDPDRDAPHVRAADSAVHLGPARAYLDVERVIDAARRAGAEAVHPGYGFLAENPALARACAAAGIVFVGPPAQAIEVMGDKINAKRTVAAAGVPVVPGRDEPGMSDEELAAAALEIGLPVLLKPSAGGGGKGMRRVDEPSELARQIAAARREAAGAFGDATLLVERLVSRPRHIEVQVLADRFGATVSLGERECSLQRRHQKIVEEAPSPLLDDAARAAMGASAVAAARACGYVGAGTVEFLVPGDRPAEHFFMEMNTRLQVEHPVTEMVLGIDLVEWQLRVAAGERLGAESLARPRGHAVEARVYAEDPARGFLPASGTVLGLRGALDPAGAGRSPHLRVEEALRVGMTVGTAYDPMLAKVIAWGTDRPEALARLASALRECAVLGLTTNVGFLRRLLEHPDVAAGRLDTGLVEQAAPQLAAPASPPEDVLVAAALLEALAPEGPPEQAPPGPWDTGDSWRVGGPVPRRSRWRAGAGLVEVTVHGAGTGGALGRGQGRVRVADGPERSAGAVREGDTLVVDIEGVSRRWAWATEGDTVWLAAGGDAWGLTLWRETIDHAGPAPAGDGPVTSPMPGTVLSVHVAVGDTVQAGQVVAAVEAMKMEHTIVAPLDGTVTHVLVEPGDSVRLDQALAVITEEGRPRRA